MTAVTFAELVDMPVEGVEHNDKLKWVEGGGVVLAEIIGISPVLSADDLTDERFINGRFEIFLKGGSVMRVESVFEDAVIKLYTSLQLIWMKHMRNVHWNPITMYAGNKE